MNTQIHKQITDEEELVDDICEAEEIKEALTTTITRVKQILESLKSLPVNTLSSPPPDENPHPVSGEPESTVPGIPLTTDADTNTVQNTTHSDAPTLESSPALQPNPVSGT